MSLIKDIKFTMNQLSDIQYKPPFSPNSYNYSSPESLDGINSLYTTSTTIDTSLLSPTIKQEGCDYGFNYDIDMFANDYVGDSGDNCVGDSGDNCVTNSSDNSLTDMNFDDILTDVLDNTPSSIDTNTTSNSITHKLPKSSTQKSRIRKKLTKTQKKAHNQVEKNYRINLNTKIETLQNLIPEIALEQTGFNTSTNKVTKHNDSKMNKSLILDFAIQYINQLKCQQASLLRDNMVLKEQLSR